MNLPVTNAICGLATCLLVQSCGLPAPRLAYGTHAPSAPHETRRCPWIPAVASDWQRVYAPSNHRYLNDHTIVRGDDGRFHLYGITNVGAGDPQTEVSLLHATASALTGPWREQADVFDAERKMDERVLWAPYALNASPGHWLMYFWAGSRRTESTTRGLRMATSLDLDQWQRFGAMDHVDQRPRGGRDPFVLHTASGWLMYSVGVSPIEASGLAHGRIVVSHSASPAKPRGWGEPVTVLEDPSENYPWGNLESPFVVSNVCGYYLFVTRTNRDAQTVDYDRTLVFFSSDPVHFEWRVLTEFRAHAAEIVDAGNGVEYVTSAGWPAVIGEARRGLSVANLAWNPAPASAGR